MKKTLANQAFFQLVEAQTSQWARGYNSVVARASKQYNAGKFGACLTTLKVLPSVDCLLEELEGKLKGKRLYSSLKQFREGKMPNRFSRLKTLSSLFTHCLIECERGNSKFERLLPIILGQLNAME